MTANDYWKKIKLPVEFYGMSIVRFAALQKLVKQAFNAGKKDAAR